MNAPVTLQAADHTHSPEVERAAIAVVLDGRHLTAFEQLMGIIQTPLAFYVRDHQIIILGCQEVAAKGGIISGQTVAEALSHIPFANAWEALSLLAGDRNKRPTPEDAARYEDSALASIGGWNTVADMAAVFGPVASLEHNCKIIAAHHLQRQAIAAMASAIDALKRPDGVTQRAKIVDRVTTGILGPSTGIAENAIGHFVRSAMTSHDEIQAGGERRSARWGLPGLDDVVELTPGSVTTVAGVTGGGKTSLVLTAMEATASHYGPGSVAMVSMEMRGEELGSILIARKLRVTRREVDRGQLRAEVREMVADHLVHFDALGIQIRDKAQRNTITDIVAWARQRHRITGGALALLVVDHVGLISKANPRASLLDVIGDAYRDLKSFALSTGVPVIVLNQYNRDAKAERRNGIVKADPKPRMQDLKMAGEADSDNIVMLWKPNLDTGPRQDRFAVCPKVRSGPPGDVPLIFEPACGQRFYDPEHVPDRKPNTIMFEKPSADPADECPYDKRAE